MSKNKQTLLEKTVNESIRDFYIKAYKDGRRETVKKMIERVKELPLTPSDKRLVIETIKSPLFL